jgi:16S rRNA (uracil1498-N3)-methyltransferase
MSHRVYLDHPLVAGELSIEGDEAHHLAGVCRVRPGEVVYLFNGDGLEYGATVLNIGHRRVTVRIDSVFERSRELPHRLEIACPMPKSDRGRYLVEKLTELGVWRFVPLRTRRSIVHPDESRQDKLARYVIEASKQCGRNKLMGISPVTSWQEYLARTDLPALRFVADPPDISVASSGGVRESSSVQVRGGEDIVCAAGPEGGFTSDEIASAAANGWRRIDLGQRILRMETAALVLAAWAGQSVNVV